MITKKLDQLNNREKILIVVALVFVAGMLADRLVIRLALTQLRRIEYDSQAEQTRLENNLAVLAAAPGIAQRYERILPRLGEVEPAAVAIDRLQGRLDELAQDSGIVIHAMRHRESDALPPETPYMNVVIEISRFEGELPAFLTFLEYLRSSPEIWRVVRMTLTPDKGGTHVNGSMLIAQLRLRAD